MRVDIELLQIGDNYDLYTGRTVRVTFLSEVTKQRHRLYKLYKMDDKVPFSGDSRDTKMLLQEARDFWDILVEDGFKGELRDQI